MDKLNEIGILFKAYSKTKNPVIITQIERLLLKDRSRGRN